MLHLLLLPTLLLAQAPATRPASVPPRLPPGAGGLEVLVVEEGDAKRPVPRVVVNLATPDPAAPIHSATTGADGVARFELPPGNYRIGTILENATGRNFNLPAPTVIPGKIQRMEVAVPAKAHAAGIVRGPDGQPLAGVAILVLPVISRDAVSDADGKFDIAFDPRSGAAVGNPQPPALLLIARDPARNLAAALKLPDDPKDLDLKLQPAARLTGQVFNPWGRPLPKATVWLYLSHAGQNTSFDRRPHPTDAQGRFEWSAVPAGCTYVLGATADGFGIAETRLTVEAAADPLAVDPLKLRQADKIITGVVVDESGKPVANAYVCARGPGQKHAEARTTNTGRFTLTKLVAGTVTLEASAERPAYRWGTRPAEAGALNLRIVIAPR